MKKLVSVFVLSMFVFMFSAQTVLAASVWTSGLISYWSFDTDASDDHASNDGTVTDAVYGADSGKLSGAYTFDGSGDYITMPSSSDFNFDTDDFTIAGWFYAENTYNKYATVFGNELTWGTNTWGLDWDNLSRPDKLSLWVRNYSSVAPVVESGTLNYEQWYHIVLKRDGSTFTLYVDDTSVDTETSSVSLDGTSAREFVIASNNGSGNEYWKGKADEIGIWSRALTTQEISALYNSGSALAYGADPGGAGVPEFSAYVYIATILLTFGLVWQKRESFAAAA